MFPAIEKKFPAPMFREFAAQVIDFVQSAPSELVAKSRIPEIFPAISLQPGNSETGSQQTAPTATLSLRTSVSPLQHEKRRVFHGLRDAR